MTGDVKGRSKPPAASRQQRWADEVCWHAAQHSTARHACTVSASRVMLIDGQGIIGIVVDEPGRMQFGWVHGRWLALGRASPFRRHSDSTTSSPTSRALFRRPILVRRRSALPHPSSAAAAASSLHLPPRTPVTPFAGRPQPQRDLRRRLRPCTSASTTNTRHNYHLDTTTSRHHV